MSYSKKYKIDTLKAFTINSKHAFNDLINKIVKENHPETFKECTYRHKSTNFDETINVFNEKHEKVYIIQIEHIEMNAKEVSVPVKQNIPGINDYEDAYVVTYYGAYDNKHYEVRELWTFFPAVQGLTYNKYTKKITPEEKNKIDKQVIDVLYNLKKDTTQKCNDDFIDNFNKETAQKLKEEEYIKFNPNIRENKLWQKELSLIKNLPKPNMSDLCLAPSWDFFNLDEKMTILVKENGVVVFDNKENQVYSSGIFASDVFSFLNICKNNEALNYFISKCNNQELETLYVSCYSELVNTFFLRWQDYESLKQPDKDYSIKQLINYYNIVANARQERQKKTITQK